MITTGTKQDKKKKKIKLLRSCYVQGVARPVGWCGLVSNMDHQQLVGSNFAVDALPSDKLTVDKDDSDDDADEDDDDVIEQPGEDPIIGGSRPNVRNQFVREHIARTKR